MTHAPSQLSLQRRAWALVIVALLLFRLPSFVRPAGGDQGLYEYAASRLISGDVPYRDAFEQKPPGVFLVYATASWLPPDARVAALDLMAAALTALLLLRLGTRLYGGLAGWCAAGLYLLLGDPGIQRLGGMNVRAQCETFIALAVTAALATVVSQRSRRWTLIGAGLAIGAAFWLKYNAIVYLAPVVLAARTGAAEATPGRAIRDLTSIASGFAIAVAAGLAYFVAAGALTDLWLATIEYNVAYSRETYHGFLDAIRYVVTLPIDRARVDGLWFIGGLGAVVLMATRQAGSRLIPFVWVGVAIVSIAINGARSLPQYFVQAGPALALVGSAGLVLAWRHRKTRAGATVFAVVGIVLIAGSWRVGMELTEFWKPRLFGLPQAIANVRADVNYLRGMTSEEIYLGRFDRGDGGKYSPLPVRRLAERIRQTPSGDTALVFGFSSGAVLTRAGRRSASRFFWSRPVVIEFAANRQGYGSAGLLAELQQQRPAIVALQKHDWGLAETIPDSMEFFLTTPPLREWLDRGYEPDYEDAAYVVWRRKVLR